MRAFMSFYFILFFLPVPSCHDILAVAGYVDDYSLARFGGRLVSDLRLNLTVLQLVAVQIHGDQEIVDAVQIDVRVGIDEAFRCLYFPFAYKVEHVNSLKTRLIQKLINCEQRSERAN